MSDKSRAICLSSILAILIASLPCAYFLLLQEYVRIAVLGLVVFALFLIYRSEFAKAFWRRALLGLCVVYVIYACDPLTAGSFDPQKETAVFYYVYAILVIMALGVDFILVAMRVLLKRQYAKNFFKSISLTEWVIYLIVLNVMLFLSITEITGMIRGGSNIIYSVLTCFKPVGAIFLFFLITRFCDPKNSHGREAGEEGKSGGSRSKPSYDLLVIFFIGFSFYTAVFGGARVAVAVSNTRFMNRDANRLKARNQDAYNALMRAFSLCDQEAARVYQLGYLAGQRKWKEMSDLAETNLNTGRQLEKEALISALIGQTQDLMAAYYTDSLDPSYRFMTPAVTQNIQRVIKDAQKNSYLLYFLSRLQAMSGNQVIARNYLTTFSFNYPDNPNAAFLSGTFSQSADKIYTINCNYWLTPMEDAAVDRTSEEIVMLNGRYVAGHLWLPKGKYVMTLYARDEGSNHEKAKEVNFDPTCKAEVWVGDESHALSVLSENRRFQPYEMEFNVQDNPAVFILRFTNDRDEGGGLDRNLGIEKLEIKCAQ